MTGCNRGRPRQSTRHRANDSVLAQTSQRSATHHDAITFLIISGHLSLALILQLPGTAGGLPGPVPARGLVSGRACCDTAIGPSWAARRQCPDWTPVTLGPG